MDDKPKPTKFVHKPLARFKNPNGKTKPTTDPIAQVGFILPDGEIRFIRVDQGITIGRGTETIESTRKLNLDGVGGLKNGVSRNHALIRWHGGHIVIKDYNSLNGTFLNKSELYPMRDYVLRNGDEIEIGRIRLKIKIESGD